MTQDELYKEIPKRVKERFGVDITAQQAEQVIRGYIDQIFLMLADGKTVNLTDVGKLEVILSKSRTGRHPQTGDPITIPAKKRVKFRQSSVIGRILNG